MQNLHLELMGNLVLGCYACQYILFLLCQTSQISCVHHQQHDTENTETREQVRGF